jgi:uncharacterized membrane protein AbrB (regulator of aidB expression)
MNQILIPIPVGGGGAGTLALIGLLIPIIIILAYNIFTGSFNLPGMFQMMLYAIPFWFVGFILDCHIFKDDRKWIIPIDIAMLIFFLVFSYYMDCHMMIFTHYNYCGWF